MKLFATCEEIERAGPHIALKYFSDKNHHILTRKNGGFHQCQGGIFRMGFHGDRKAPIFFWEKTSSIIQPRADLGAGGRGR